MVLCAAVIFFVPNISSHLWIVLVIFVGSALAAAWPWLRRDAPYTFWVFACLLWFCSGLVFEIVSALVK